MDLVRARIDVEAQGLGLKWIRAWPGSANKKRVEKVILEDVNIRFPAGEVTAILVSGFSELPLSTLIMLDALPGRVPVGRASRHCFSYSRIGQCKLVCWLASNARGLSLLMGSHSIIP
jgi:hypothetical protein